MVQWNGVESCSGAIRIWISKSVTGMEHPWRAFTSLPGQVHTALTDWLSPGGDAGQGNLPTHRGGALLPTAGGQIPEPLLFSCRPDPNLTSFHDMLSTRLQGICNAAQNFGQPANKASAICANCPGACYFLTERRQEEHLRRREALWKLRWALDRERSPPGTAPRQPGPDVRARGGCTARAVAAGPIGGAAAAEEERAVHPPGWRAVLPAAARPPLSPPLPGAPSPSRQRGAGRPGDSLPAPPRSPSSHSTTPAHPHLASDPAGRAPGSAGGGACAAPARCLWPPGGSGLLRGSRLPPPPPPARCGGEGARGARQRGTEVPGRAVQTKERAPPWAAVSGGGRGRGAGVPALAALFPGAPAGQVPAGGPGCAAAAPFAVGAQGLGLPPAEAGRGGGGLPLRRRLRPPAFPAPPAPRAGQWRARPSGVPGGGGGRARRCGGSRRPGAGSWAGRCRARGGGCSARIPPDSRRKRSKEQIFWWAIKKRWRGVILLYYGFFPFPPWQSVWREGRCCCEQVGGRRGPVPACGGHRAWWRAGDAAATRVPDRRGEPRAAAWGAESRSGEEGAGGRGAGV